MLPDSERTIRMKRLLPALIVLAFAGAAVAAPQSGKPAPAKPAPKAPTKAKVAEVPACPITGEKVADIKTAEKSVYKGKTYYFCCGGCKPAFDKNPAKYVKAEPAKPAKTEPAKKKV